MNTILEVRNLSKVFGGGSKTTVRAVDDVSLSIEEGSTFGLLGESGSGKSTLARLIPRLIEPTSGEIIYKGRGLQHLKDRELRTIREQIQIVFQNPFSSLNPRMTVRQLIGEPLIVHKRSSGAALEQQVRDMMNLVGLNPEHTHRFPHEFSGGQRQRIGIARALALEPQLLVADESVSALDVSVQAQVLTLLQDIQKRLNLAVIFITHDLRVAAQVCHQIVVMHKGRIVEHGTPAEVFDQPRDSYTKNLIAAIPGQHWSPIASSAAPAHS